MRMRWGVKRVSKNAGWGQGGEMGMRKADETYVPSFGIVRAAEGVDLAIPVGRLVDELDHADVAELLARVDHVRHPLEPFESTTIVVVIVEPDRRRVLAGEGLVGLLGTGATMEATEGLC